MQRAKGVCFEARSTRQLTQKTRATHAAKKTGSWHGSLKFFAAETDSKGTVRQSDENQNRQFGKIGSFEN